MGDRSSFSQESTNSIVGALTALLSNNYILYFKTLNCHWNVEDPSFLSLHELFEHQYIALAKQGDEIAERIRILGRKVPGNLRTFLEMGTLEEISEDYSAKEMLEKLNKSHEKMILQLREDILLSDELGDPGTTDLLTDILRFHEKTAWFLRSHVYV